MFQITIPLLYLAAGLAFAGSRLPQFADRLNWLVSFSFLVTIGALSWHLAALGSSVFQTGGLRLSLAHSASFVGAQLALVALIAGMNPRLRGLCGGLLVLAAITSLATGATPGGSAVASSWQLQAHILISLFAYGMLAVGAIVALFALIQEKRLRAKQLSSINQLFAPLETSEQMLTGITAAGFLTLLLGVLSGFLFVDNLFAQHLVHKTVLSLIALILFGVLLAGRQFAGWRGRTAVTLYLWGFGALCLAYFGSRYILENLLGRSWS